MAHPVLKGPEAQNIARQFDKYQELTEAMKNAAHGQQLTVDVSFLAGLRGILRPSKFRREMGAYVKLQGLDSSIADDETKWTNFLT